MQTAVTNTSNKLKSAIPRGHQRATTRSASVVVKAAAQEPHQDNNGDWQFALSGLQQRIEQLRKAQALHMLEHRYSRERLVTSVDEAVEGRPDISEGAHVLSMWHEDAWAKLAADLDGSK